MSVTSYSLGHRNICVLSALVVVFLAACGGGGGAGDNGNNTNGNSNNANGNNNANDNNANGNNGCTDQCPTAADTRCENGWVRRCGEDADGCLGWLPIADCASANERCDDSQQPAACVTDCNLSSPDAPTSPMPPDGATDVMPSISTIHWADATGAARYAVYHDVVCPPPSYPDAAFVEIVSSSL